jgi:hypothetical protein
MAKPESSQGVSASTGENYIVTAGRVFLVALLLIADFVYQQDQTSWGRRPVQWTSLSRENDSDNDGTDQLVSLVKAAENDTDQSIYPIPTSASRLLLFRDPVGYHRYWFHYTA